MELAFTRKTRFVLVRMFQHGAESLTNASTTDLKALNKRPVHFRGQTDLEQPGSYPVDMHYHGHGLGHTHPANGHPDNSPASSHLSVAGDTPQIVRTQKQQTTQQVKYKI